MHKFLFLALIAVAYIFHMQLLHGRGGQADDARVKAQIAKQIKLNAELRERNEMMELKIAGLKGSTDSLEARARNELNLVKPGEVLVLLPGSDLNIKPTGK